MSGTGSRSWQALLCAGLLAVGWCGAAAAGELACVGDCNDDGVVAVNEIIAGVNIALGNAAIDTCAAFDRNGDDRADISELIAGVANLLYGCGFVPPTSVPTETPSGGPIPSSTPVATDTAPAADTPTPTPTRTVKPTGTATRTPTTPLSICGGLVQNLPVVCNLTIIPNPVSRSGTIQFRFGISDLNGDVNRICIQLTLPPLPPTVSCTNLTPPNRLINNLETTSPVSASPLQFGTYQAAVQAHDRAGNTSNVTTATFTVQ